MKDKISLATPIPLRKGKQRLACVLFEKLVLSASVWYQILYNRPFVCGCVQCVHVYVCVCVCVRCVTRLV